MALLGAGAWYYRFGGGSGIPGVGPDGDGGESPPGPATREERPAPVLTDEDRVVAILRERGGRAGQSTIVEATDWSKSKVSRVLSGMEEDGQIRKIDVGRENVVTLPEAEPERAKPPFEADEPPEQPSRN
ncbi:MAG: helix-turn-helix transcriptional regulator [Halobacteriales archaeon]